MCASTVSACSGDSDRVVSGRLGDPSAEALCDTEGLRPR